MRRFPFRVPLPRLPPPQVLLLSGGDDAGALDIANGALDAGVENGVRYALASGVAALVRPGITLLQVSGREDGRPLLGRRNRALELAWFAGASLELAAAAGKVRQTSAVQAIARALREEADRRTPANAQRFARDMVSLLN